MNVGIGMYICSEQNKYERMEISSLYLLKKNYVSKSVGEELVLVPLRGNVSQMQELFTLNETGRFVWENLHEQSSVEELIVKMTNEYEVTEDQAQTDILLFLEKLQRL